MTVGIEERSDSLVVTVGDATVSYSVSDRNGIRRGVSASSALLLQPGDNVVVEFAGFGKGSTARSWLLPASTLLGETRLNAGAGSIVSIVPETTPVGEHRIVTEALARNGKNVVVAYGVRIAEHNSSRSPWSAVLIVIVGLAVAFGLFIPAARRRRNDD